MTMRYVTSLKGHGNWVTALACPQGAGNGLKVVSASRDNTLVAWRNGADESEAIPARRLEGHSGFVEDVVLSTTADYAMSCSWDRSMRLWDVKKGETLYRFNGHTHDVMSVAFSPDDSRIASGSRDKTVKIWNVRGECVQTLGGENGHSDWVTCVRFNQSSENTLLSVGWDGTARVWDLNTYKCDVIQCGSQVNCVTVSPDSSLFATADKEGMTKLWDTRARSALYTLNSDEPVNQICFSPNRYWLCAATASSIRIYDLESKEALTVLEPEAHQENKKNGKWSGPECTSIAWSSDGTYLYSGYTDNTIRIWAVISE